MDLEYYYKLGDGDPKEAIVNAIRARDWEAFKTLLSVQESINVTDDTILEWSLLMWVVHEESMEMVKLLVEAGADVNYRAIDSEEFALSEAIYCENQNIFNYLEPLTSPELQAIARQIRKRRKRYYRS
ncbi:MAG: hypothetical protein SWX82_02105 [Cyanobacteriota bacterium]|nr:hypothetical protein [Cyanobacteriota bacterium]